MGLFSTLARALGLTRDPVSVLVIGLDNSGKSTLIQRIKPKRATVNEVAPTVGFSVEEFSKNGLSMKVVDMSGQNRYRSLWENYYEDVRAIIFVVDSTDTFRMEVARDELHLMLEHANIAGRPIPLLFFANKSDLPSAMPPPDIMEALRMETIQDKPWHITASSALSGEGVEDGIDWLADQLSNRRPRK